MELVVGCGNRRRQSTRTTGAAITAWLAHSQVSPIGPCSSRTAGTRKVGSILSQPSTLMLSIPACRMVLARTGVSRPGFRGDGGQIKASVKHRMAQLPSAA
jgi:hypothetical protein